MSNCDGSVVCFDQLRNEFQLHGTEVQYICVSDVNEWPIMFDFLDTHPKLSLLFSIEQLILMLDIYF